MYQENSNKLYKILCDKCHQLLDNGTASTSTTRKTPTPANTNNMKKWELLNDIHS